MIVARLKAIEKTLLKILFIFWGLWLLAFGLVVVRLGFH